MSAPGGSERRRVLAVAALIERDGRVLMSQRRADQSLPLLWEFPGGKIEIGESPEAALAREIREELGCEIAVGRVHDVVFFAYQGFDLVMLVYRAEIVAGAPAARQVAAVAWVAREQLPALDLPAADAPLARRLAAGR